MIWKVKLLSLCKELFLTLTLKAPIPTAADDILIVFFYFSEKTSLDIACESSALLNMNKNLGMLSSATNFAWCFKS